jgi:hypothetical protein
MGEFFKIISCLSKQHIVHERFFLNRCLLYDNGSSKVISLESFVSTHSQTSHFILIFKPHLS